MPKRSFLRFGLSFLSLVLILSFSLDIKSAEKASVQEILSNPDKYDYQEVIVQGKAIKIRNKISQKGNEYTTFNLTDSSGRSLSVFSWGNPGIKEGQNVSISGIYQKVKRVGNYTFYNEVEAKTIK